MPIQPQANKQSDERGIYNVTEGNLAEINRLENLKQNFLLSISDYEDMLHAVSDLLDITVSMEGFINLYFGQDGMQYKVEKWNIVEYQIALEDILRKKVKVNAFFLRRVAQNIFTIWDVRFIKPMNLTLPTQRPDFFRRFLTSLFGTLHKFDDEKFKLEYFEAMKVFKWNPNDYFNFMAYCFSRRKDFDLDTSIIIIGARRISKSTMVKQLNQKIYKLWDRQWNNSFIDRCVIWNAQEGFDRFVQLKEDIVWADEAVFVADRRQSMERINVRYTQIMNALADHKNITETVIQDYSMLESRIKSGAHVLVLVYERGSALVYAQSQNFPIVQSMILDNDKFQRQPRILGYKDRALYELKKLPTYMFEIEYEECKSDDEVWTYYKGIKEKAQEKAIIRIKESVDKKEEIKELQEAKDIIVKSIRDEQNQSNMQWRNRILKCLKCGYSWTPRGNIKPAACTNCHRYSWDKEKGSELFWKRKKIELRMPA